ncbi:hypothetical protein RhiTH_010450 [Rhizoctonia solani]
MGFKVCNEIPMFLRLSFVYSIKAFGKGLMAFYNCNILNKTGFLDLGYVFFKVFNSAQEDMIDVEESFFEVKVAGDDGIGPKDGKEDEI